MNKTTAAFVSAASVLMLIGAGCASQPSAVSPQPSAETTPAPDAVPTPTPETSAASDCGALPEGDFGLGCFKVVCQDGKWEFPSYCKAGETCDAGICLPTPPPATAKSFTVTGDNFKFDLAEMRVKKGDTVRVTFKNAEGFHDWKLDEFGAATQKLQAAQEETIEFVADKAGTFEYYCSVGKHRTMGMKGNLIVE